MLVSPLLAADCESGWVRGPYQSSSCYKFVSAPRKSWSGAVQTCSDLGGYLATLDTTDELIWMKGYISYYATELAVSSTWIGGFQLNGTGQWLWRGETTHTPIIESDWAPGQPDNCCSGQHCLALFGTRAGTSSSKWDDGQCGSPLPFACEKMLWEAVVVFATCWTIDEKYKFHVILNAIKLIIKGSLITNLWYLHLSYRLH